MPEEIETMFARTSFTPLRFVVGSKEPIALNVEVRNKVNEVRNYGVSLRAPTAFGFDAGILMHDKRIRIGSVPPGQSKDAVFLLYGKPMIRAGTYDFFVVVREYGERFDKEQSMREMKCQLRVVD